MSPVPPALEHRCYKQTKHPQTLPHSCPSKLQEGGRREHLHPKGDKFETFPLQAGNAAWAPSSCSQRYYITGTCSTDNLDGLNTSLWNQDGLFQLGLVLAHWRPMVPSVLPNVWQGSASPGPLPCPLLQQLRSKTCCLWEPEGLWVASQGMEISLCKEGRLQTQRGTDGPTPQAVGAAPGAPPSSSFLPGVTAFDIRAAKVLWLQKSQGTFVISWICDGGQPPSGHHSPVQRKGKCKSDKKDGKSKNATADVWQSRMKSHDSSQKWKYLLVTMFVAHRNRSNRTSGRNVLTYISIGRYETSGIRRYTYVEHILQQCKVIIMSACYWSTWYFFNGFLRQDIFFSKVSFSNFTYQSKGKSKAQQKLIIIIIHREKYKCGAERYETIRRKKQLETEIAALPRASNNSLREADSEKRAGRTGKHDSPSPGKTKE